MKPEEYKDKLIQFNSTDKYRQEMDFMYKLISPKPNDRIMDYGCGIGTMVKRFLKEGFIAYGYDKHDYTKENWFKNEVYFKLNHIYFMHSLAHIEEPYYLLEKLKELLEINGCISVITPNLNWLMESKSEHYKPDPTVIQHFTPETLRDHFTDSGYKILHEGQFGEVKHGCSERLFIKATI